ncbi:MAG TPA: DUF5343 domain-containing protein [Chloroflexota bacterium]|nr:DUF5343 domain-containing protein [Chloroflexota bacterium]
MATRSIVHSDAQTAASLLAARRAPYAPVGALHGFLSSIRNGRPPARVDVAYVKSHSLARANEWALLSALKFLGVVDPRGYPTSIFRQLQGAPDGVKQALSHLVLGAYKATFDAGAAHMTQAQLKTWFAENSSASQAANAARFFREACHLAGIELSGEVDLRLPTERGRVASRSKPAQPGTAASRRGAPVQDLLAKMPSHQTWKGTPSEYVRVLEIFDRLAGLL